MPKGQGGRPPMPGGGGGQMNQMMKQMQKMQADMAAAQDALADATVEGSAGGGIARVDLLGGGVALVHGTGRDEPLQHAAVGVDGAARDRAS